MAEDKRSFVLYADIINTVEALSEEEAGLLFKYLLRYVNDQNPSIDNRIVLVAFEPIKSQLKRDLKKWESLRERRVENGKRGGVAKASNTKQGVAKASNTKQGLANVAVNVNVNANVIYRAFAHLSMSKVEYDKLISEGWTKKEIDTTLDKIENYKKNTAYVSLLLTCRNWLKSKNSKGEVTIAGEPAPVEYEYYIPYDQSWRNKVVYKRMTGEEPSDTTPKRPKQ